MNARQSVSLEPAARRQDRRSLSGHHARRQRLGFARQRRRIPLPVRPFAAPRHGHAHSRGMVRQPGHGRGQARILRVPRLPDGAVGRPCRHRVHRRQSHRRHARPQRPAARPLHRDQGRSGRSRFRSRRDRSSAEDIRKKGRLQPGRMFLVDTVQQRIISDAEIKKQLAGPSPTGNG
jgi:hypothetical protein